MPDQERDAGNQYGPWLMVQCRRGRGRGGGWGSANNGGSRMLDTWIFYGMGK